MNEIQDEFTDRLDNMKTGFISMVETEIHNLKSSLKVTINLEPMEQVIQAQITVVQEEVHTIFNSLYSSLHVQLDEIKENLIENTKAVGATNSTSAHSVNALKKLESTLTRTSEEVRRMRKAMAPDQSVAGLREAEHEVNKPRQQ